MWISPHDSELNYICTVWDPCEVPQQGPGAALRWVSGAPETDDIFSKWCINISSTEVLDSIFSKKNTCPGWGQVPPPFAHACRRPWQRSKNTSWVWRCRCGAFQRRCGVSEIPAPSANATTYLLTYLLQTSWEASGTNSVWSPPSWTRPSPSWQASRRRYGTDEDNDDDDGAVASDAVACFRRCALVSRVRRTFRTAQRTP